MTELEKQKILEEKLPLALEELEKTIEKDSKECKKQNVLQIVSQLKEIQNEDVNVIGSRIISINPIEIEISPFDLLVENGSSKEKVYTLFEYVSEFIEDLNKKSTFEFGFSGLYFIGRFVRDNEKCTVTVNWKF